MIWRQIQWRLTFWNTLVLAIIVAVFATIVYASMHNTTNVRIATVLELTAMDTITEWQEHGELADPADRSVIAIQIANRTGSVLARYGELPTGVAVPPPSRGPARQFPADNLTVAIRTVEANGLLTTVALDVTPEQAGLVDLQRTLLLATVGSVLLSGGVGLALARFTLRPIDRMSSTARRIALVPGNGQMERLPLQGPEDELYRLGETFNAMLARIERSFERQTRFVADASHELRTPLTVLQSYVRLLTRWGRNDPKVLDEGLAAMERESERMGRLLEDLLLLARGDAGVSLEREPVAMAALLQELGRDLTVAAEGLGGRRTEAPGPVAIAVSTPEPATALGDPRYLRQLLLALADNAIQYTPSGGQVTLSLETLGAEVRVHVTDTGIGIPPEEQGQIFDRFQRVDKDRSRATGGSGLGLAIASSLAQAHGGSITCRSRPGEGSTFTLSLPRHG